MSYIYKDIIQDSDTVIRKKSVNVELPLNAEDKQLLMDMLQYVRDSQDNELAEQNGLRPAVGIAAIQLGIPQKHKFADPYTFICPAFKKYSS